MKIVDIVSKELQPIILNLNLYLYDVTFSKEGPNWYLRIFIDKDGGVNINDCETVSRLIEQRLDELDPISLPYILEVSSPGIEKTLKKQSDFLRNIGQNVEIKLYKPFHLDGKKSYKGSLLEISNDVVSIKQEDENIISFKLEDIARCKTIVLWD